MVLPCPAANAQTADVTFTIGTATTPLQSLLGVNAGPLHWNGHLANKDLFAEYAQIGVKAVRSHDFPEALDMSVMYPNRTKDPTLQTSYNFTRPGGTGDYGSDYAVSSLQSNGLQLYLRIWGSGAELPSSERANWVKAAVEVIRHYQEGKWAGYTGLVNSVEIGNEPDSSYFWSTTYTKEEFYQLYVDTAKAIRAAFPTMKIGGPGITQSGFSNTTGQAWVRGFFDYVKANGAPLDFFSWHLYSNSPDQFSTAASFYRSELDSRGYTATELHTTEWNTQIDLTVNPPPSSVQATNLEYRTKAKGAALMTATWMALHQSGIKQSYFYRGNNNDANDYQNYGLFAVDGTPRKIALAFGLWSEFTDHQNRIDPTASTSISGLKAMAAQRSDGQIAILVANTGTTSRNWSAAFTDTRNLSNYSMILRTVDDSSATTTTSVPTGTVFTIAPNTVQLLLAAAKVTATGTVVEFYNTGLDNYFITADSGEAAAIDGGSAGPGWSRTGNTFNSGGSTSVCRFYGSMSPGPNSHFYTADSGECAYLKQLQASTPSTQKRWNYESLDFLTTTPFNGACQTGTTPVYRAYNNGSTRNTDSNHRITSSQAAIQQVVLRGWSDEGVVMCAPN